MVFKRDDLVVYPAHGIGRIEDVQVKTIEGERKEFYVVRMIENDMKIMLPVGNTKSIGIRPLIGKEDIRKVFEIFERREISVVASTWNKRYREYMDKIKSGSIFELAEVLRDLHLIQVEKSLSFGEKKMLETARALIVKEIALVAEISESDADEMVRSFFVLKAGPSGERG